MRLPASLSEVADRQRQLSPAAAALCLPLSAAGGLRLTLVLAALAAPALALIWIGDGLSEADAGRLLTAPAWREGRRASMFKRT